MAEADASTGNYAKLIESFKVAAHSLISSCSEEEFKAHFKFCKPEELNKIYKLLLEVMAAVHKNAEAEFEVICKESKVMEELSYNDRLLHDSGAESFEMSLLTSKSLALAIQKDVIELKSRELNNLKLMLRQEEEVRLKNLSHVEVLRRKAKVLNEARSVDSMASKLQKVIKSETAADEL